MYLECKLIFCVCFCGLLIAVNKRGVKIQITFACLQLLFVLRLEFSTYRKHFSGKFSGGKSKSEWFVVSPFRLCVFGAIFFSLSFYLPNRFCLFLHFEAEKDGQWIICLIGLYGSSSCVRVSS